MRFINSFYESMDLDPMLLRTFVAVNETGSFTRAARRLHLTQPAVSHQVKRLEETLGRPLLYRTTRRLTLTEDGAELMRHAEQILGALDAVARRFQPSLVSGVVRFAVQDSFMGDRLPPLLCQFTRAFPSVRLEVNVGPGMDFCGIIDSGEFDLAVVLCLPEKVTGTLLRKTRFVWVAADYFRPISDASLPLVFYPTPCVSREAGFRALKDHARPWHNVFTSPSKQGLRAAVLGGLGITVLTQEDVEPGMAVVDGQFGLPPLPEACFTLITHPGDKTPAVREFGRLIRSMSGALTGSRT